MKNIVKSELVERACALLDQKIQILAEAIEYAKESKASDTKSSAGDKYETGRAMIQMEQEKNEVQLNKTMRIKNEISRISLGKPSQKVRFGSLVGTNRGAYFVAVALGKIEHNSRFVYFISLASPLGNALENKEAGDSFMFNNQNIRINSVI